MAKPTEADEKPLAIRGIVSAKGRAEVVIRGDGRAKAVRGLIRLLTVYAELMEEAEAEERAMAAEEPRADVEKGCPRCGMREDDVELCAGPEGWGDCPVMQTRGRGG